MTSTAISAQGSTLQIGTGTGGAKTITGVALGNPTIITSAAHGLSNGDVVALASIGGTTNLNGLTVVVKNKTTNTFAVDVDTTGGIAYTTGGTATPVTYTTVANVKTFSGFDGAASELDVTNLSSTAKEFRLGLVDPGQFTIEVDRDTTDSGQSALLAAQVSGAAKSFKLTLPNAAVASFTGYVKKFAAQGGVDQVVKTSCDIRISGPVTWA